MPRARSQEVLQKRSYAQATIEWTWSNGESLLLLFCLPVALVEMAILPLRIRISHAKPKPTMHLKVTSNYTCLNSE